MSRRKRNRLGVSGDYTSTSVRWRLCGKPTGWQEATMGHRELTGSHSKPSRKAGKAVFSSGYVSTHAGTEEGDTEGRGQSPRTFDSDGDFIMHVPPIALRMSSESCMSCAPILAVS